MNSLVEMVEESERKLRGVEVEFSPPRKWISIEQAGLNFRGRFVPENEYDPESFTTKLSVEAKVNFEAWLRETTTLAVNTEINCQLGEFTIKKHVTHPLDNDIQKNVDFISVFQAITSDDIIQCAEVKHTTHRKWLRLIGMEHDIQVWDVDSRQAYHPFKKQYSSVEPDWIRNIVDSWMARIYPGIELFVDTDSSNKQVSLLYGYWPKEGAATLKEIVVYKYPRFLQVFNIVEYGRRWYRTLIFSSDPVLCYHDMEYHSLSLSSGLVGCCGDPTLSYKPSTSITIIKYPHHDKTNEQIFIPSRYLYGTLPDSLLDYYAFWQNKDDSLTGYITRKDGYFSAASELFVQIVKSGSADSIGFGFCNAQALVTRRSETDVGTDNWLHLVNSLTVFSSYVQFIPENDLAENAQRYWTDDANTSHALLRTLLRLESLSHILLWSRSVGQTSMSASIDLIEMPRLRLTFERKSVGSEFRYYCVEQPGFFLSSPSTCRKGLKALVDVPSGIFLQNDLGELILLMSALSKPGLVRAKKGGNSYRLVFNRTNLEWNANTGDITYFIFPVHVSGALIQSRSVASTLYLLVLYLMNRKYGPAFRLIDSCVCDRSFSSQELQIFNLLGSIKDSLLVDGASCRLKLFFTTYGCSDVMTFPFSIESDLRQYVDNFDLLSSECRLTPDQEMFVLSKLSAETSYKSSTMINRERLMKVCFELSFQQSVSNLSAKSFSPEYLPYARPDPYHVEPFDLDLLDVDKPTYKNMLQKLQYVKYTRPENMSGPDCLSFLLKVFSQEKNLGFFFLYELMMNGLPITIIPDTDKPRDIASVLLHVLPESYIFGVQRVILEIMETHPELVSRMPVFEDKRRLKIPTLAGLDVFQSHIKAVSSFLKSSKSEIDLVRVKFVIPPVAKPPVVIAASDDIVRCSKYGEGRMWFSPRVVDYACESVVVTHSLIPDLFQGMVDHYSEKHIQELVTAPLMTPSLSIFVDYTAAINDNSTTSSSGISVMSHPSSRSHIARSSVTRLEDDFVNFHKDAATSSIPYIKFLPIQVSELSKVAFNSALQSTNNILSSLLKIKETDIQTAFEFTRVVEEFTNGLHPYFHDNFHALGHSLMETAGSELFTVFIFSSFFFLSYLFFSPSNFWCAVSLREMKMRVYEDVTPFLKILTFLEFLVVYC
jgi:hypothetical protein